MRVSSMKEYSSCPSESSYVTRLSMVIRLAAGGLGTTIFQLVLLQHTVSLLCRLQVNETTRFYIYPIVHLLDGQVFKHG